MKELSGAEVLVESLNDLGVKQVFGYTGAAILPVFHALSRSPLEIIINSNEQCAAFSAAGVSRSSGKVGVAVVTSGPAITNTLTAVADANSDSIPLIVIAGQVPEHKIGTDSFQHINVEAVFGDASKAVMRLSNDQDVEMAVKDAYFLSKSGKPGPVVIDFPLDKQQKPHQYRGQDVDIFRRSYSEERHLSDRQCQDFFELLLASKRPLLYIGGGLNSLGGSRSIRRFQERFSIPSVHTLMAKGIEDGRERLNLGMLGMFGTPYANMAIQENDFFFAIGVRWDDRVAEKVGFDIGKEIAYIDVNPVKMHQIMIERKPRFSHRGDAQTAIDDLMEYAERNDITLSIGSWREKAADLKKSWPLSYRRDSNEIQSAEVLGLLSSHIDDKTLITTGVGNHQMLAAQYLDMLKPKSFMTSGSYGTMGFALPTAIGSYFANPDSKVIAVDGDGSLRMNFGELHTIATLGLPIKVLLLNNMSDGMVQNLQDYSFNGERVGSQRKKDINFARIAQDLGFGYSSRVICRDGLLAGMESFLASVGPSFLEVMTDREEILYPRVPAGLPYKDMILGPYIERGHNCASTQSGGRYVKR